MWERADRSLKSAGVAALAVAALCLTGRAGAQVAADSDFMPHGYCYLWNPHIVWLNVVSDGLITLSYYCIPIVLIYFIRKRRDLPFNWIFWMFGSFILACGTTHLMEIWNIWHGSYLVSGIIKAVTAAISVATAVRLIPLLPQAVAVPNLMDLRERNRKLESEVAERRRFHEELVEAPLSRSAATLSRTALGWLLALAVTSGVLLSYGRKDYPDLHTILDTCMFLLAGLLALLLWDIGARGDRAFCKWLAVSFALTSASEFLHALTSMDWSGRWAQMAPVTSALRPATWPPGAHLLPIGILYSIWLLRRGQRGTVAFALTLFLLACGLVAVFYWLPRYTPMVLGISRAQLMGVPLLWGLVALACWRLRAEDRILASLALMAIVLVLANVAMLYSRAPHDTQAMVAHLGKVGGYLVLLLSLMQMASFDMLERVRSEKQLAQLNEELEHRIVERTGRLDATNQALESEIAVREKAEAALQRSLAASDQALRELADQKFALDQHAIVAITDVQGTITYVNDKFCAISRYSKDELIGQNHRILNSGYHTKEFFQNLYRTIAKGQVWHDEICNRAKDGSMYWVDTTVVPFVGADGKPRQYVAIRADITERKLAQNEILNLNGELESRVVERTAQLQSANKELEAFSYSVSHDLRAPLRHIIGFSRMLQEEFGSALDSSANHYLDRIQAGTQKMGLLVDELLNLARVGRHALNRQPVRLWPMVVEVVAILEPDAAGRQVEWIIDELPEVDCDPVLVKQVFQNLLANALKFTRPCMEAGSRNGHQALSGTRGSSWRPVIQISCREEDGQTVFDVRDNGIGFNMKYVDKLFGVFQRLHRAEEYEGTGIGLATVQRIVHKHGGRVWAEGEVGKGATFSFTLSAAPGAEAKNNAATAGGQS